MVPTRLGVTGSVESQGGTSRWYETPRRSLESIDVTCSCVTERDVIMAAHLTGDCAGRGVRVAARESLPTGVNESLGLRRSPPAATVRLARARRRLRRFLRRGQNLRRFRPPFPFGATSRLRHGTRDSSRSGRNWPGSENLSQKVSDPTFGRDCRRQDVRPLRSTRQ